MDEDNERILVIDDNPKNLDMLAELLDEQNFIVLFALDGLSGIQRAECGKPDLILLDIMMPDIDGFETCRRLKMSAATRDIPVIFMTALSDTADKIKGFTLGAVDYITKPIQPAEVVARIRTHLQLQRLQQDLYIKNSELQAALQREKEFNALKSRFISIASHEFRTPLTTIQMTADALKRYGERMAEEKKSECFDRIKSAVKRMTDLLNDVLMLSRAEAEIHEFHPVLTDMKMLAEQVLYEFRSMSAESHHINVSISGQDFEIVADPKLLRYILSNLLSNAIKYSPPHSQIHVDLTRTNKEMIFRIQDQGIGISEQDQSHLFHAFHRGGNVGEISGTGLGLAIVKQFVDLHQGAITVESTLNQGTTFTIVFPIRSV
ncbi:response regulator receiver sensor signal transduction histidine kinase [Candidatus Vecturithrix granuli]|uniref:histidine kinase n=1 Tax=Vecturithrix granuli TaxID=1499967 RepID=A0A081C4H9_VECG1|nr:response regulator receiver sensor signal transduction histidine kinase [Candidatus Vecturithrix granuli]